MIKGARRRIILIVAEKRDDSSVSKLPEVVERIQRLNATVYWLTFSPFLEPFTVKAEDDGRYQTRSRANQAEAVHPNAPIRTLAPHRLISVQATSSMQSVNWPA